MLLAKINKCKNDTLKAKGDKEIQQLVKECKYDVMLLKLQKMQQLEVAIGEMKLLEGDNYKWLLANISNAGDFYKVAERLLTGDIVHPLEDV
ncbi:MULTISPECIES: hypothetical protein [unclassified Candidatus Tisiphia]|uniref:hypothetical protein n=1 Tax=unclassified Candidatus Tisiphia TaxID=2996318 RepID=UPI00312CA47D